MSVTQPLLSLQHLSYNIHGFHILNDITMQLNSGEFHILLGENGTGKSTIVKILSGIITDYSGTIHLSDHLCKFNSPRSALAKGIITLHQDTFLYDELSVADNIYLESILSQKHLSKKKKHEMAQELLDAHSIPLKSDTKVMCLNLSQRRMVELARLSLYSPKLLILDEPVVSLEGSISPSYYNMLEKLKNNGTTILYVTHKYDRVISLADNLSLLKDGRLIKTISADDYEQDNISKLLWGEYYTEKYPKIDVAIGEEVFCVEHLSTRNVLHDISFSLYKREILGITGLIGAGKSNLAKAIFGLEKKTEGTFFVDRLEAEINNVSKAIELGIAYITDDRLDNGLFLDLSAIQNAFSLERERTLLTEASFEKKIFKRYCKLLGLDINVKTKPSEMSGGEQQMLLLLRWFISNSNIFIFDEPTRNIDIPTKIDIYNLINDLISKNASVILISSNIEELIGMCDRIIVMDNGTIVHEATRNDTESIEGIYKYYAKPNS